MQHNGWDLCAGALTNADYSWLRRQTAMNGVSTVIMSGRHRSLVVILAALCVTVLHVPAARAPPGSHGALRRVITTAFGVAIGRTAGYFIGRRLARPSLCDGCSTSVNHDGYIAGGMVIGAAIGGTVAWYLTPAT